MSIRPPVVLAAVFVCSALAGCVAEDTKSSATAEAASPTVDAPVAIPTSPVAPQESTATPEVSTPVEVAPTPVETAPVESGPTVTAQDAPVVDSDMSADTGAANQPIAAASVPPWYTTLRVKDTTDRGTADPNGVGAFRLDCGYSHMAFDDPIVFPGQPGKSHLHTFFGNAYTDGLSTTASLLAANGTTCAGGTANRSAYWIPSMINGTTLRALVPTKVIIYYKSGYDGNPRSTQVAPPNGLRMVAGKSPSATKGQDGWQYFRLQRFSCGDGEGQESIPACPAGQELHILLNFPNCWDGKNLDSPDHRSHVAHAAYQADKKCPASHPVGIPTITVNVTYKVEDGANASQYRLASDLSNKDYPKDAPGGYSMHGDVWIAWDEGIKNTWMENCVKAGKDCHAYLLGDGRTLY